MRVARWSGSEQIDVFDEKDFVGNFSPLRANDRLTQILLHFALSVNVFFPQRMEILFKMIRKFPVNFLALLADISWLLPPTSAVLPSSAHCSLFPVPRSKNP